MYIRDITNTAQLKTFLDWIYRQVANNTGTVTLSANATQTVVQAPKCTTSSVVILSAQTANARAVQWNYIAGNGSFTIQHATAATTDRRFGYMIVGV